jgi:proteasome lid subunit RPN8/RPN11
MFNRETINDAKAHALRDYPNESCGFIIDDKYYPQINIAEDKKISFRISSKEYLKVSEKIQAVIHSHIEYPHASKEDLISHNASLIPFGIINIDKYKNVEEPFFFGDSLPVQPYLGRKFIISVQDCYALCRDYYRKEYNIVLKNYPRDDTWWVKGPSMLDDGYKEQGFHKIDVKELRTGDIIHMKIRSNIINHCAVYLGDNIILHHLVNRLSCRQPLHLWYSKIEYFLRHEELT